ncbi:lipopolysaccharide transport periplasmic protein LptA [Roseivivax sp. THAF40]|uniref:lipopolysaccharide transport periplasmic protein LptA n=1 Tax=unclassified Roseivivax TaxID=2639302 RepID=UPI0012A9F95F|nr:MULTISPECIES: lipopolysaccharide transport periplasmic protein LptA [unclassified Roseivivax]QFS84545.1 lipopolysaccharide transport periplasmic protein LptA [Roseivivax sp. THAF197b]QFT48372.1 lipopolysaccharide transport periplasmic protein LptA [Roseivivax sp. THAF40]
MVYRLLLALMAGFMPSVLFAQGTEVTFGTMQQDSSLPVEVSADQLSVDQSSGTAVYSGDVVVGQGDMRLAAARVLVVYIEGAGQVERMEATGGVTLVSGEEAAEAERADYNLTSGTVVMTGNVLLTQGGNALTSDRMVVNLEDGTAQMEGRVRSVFQPQDDADGTATGADQ